MAFRRFVLTACAVVLLLVTQLWVFMPFVPRSILGWAALVALGLPVSMLIEWLGEVALDRRTFHRLSRPARILVTVPVVLALAALAFALIRGVRALSAAL